MDDRLLALDRFPQRSFLGGLARSRRPRVDPGSVVGSLAWETRRRWAAMWSIEPDDVVLCASATEAVALLCGAVLAPGDVAVLAEPAPVRLPAAVLAVGGRYVDVGRKQDGAIDVAAAKRALAAHDGAVAWAGGVIGGSDCAALRGAGSWRMLFADAADSVALNGDIGALTEGADAVVIALSDPDADAAAVLHAVVTRPGLGAGLQAVRGPSELPIFAYERAIATLERLAADPAASSRFEEVLDAAAERVRGSAPEHPGLVDLGRTGRSLAFACLGGDADIAARGFRQAGFRGLAYGGHPMRDLLVFDLAAISALGT